MVGWVWGWKRGLDGRVEKCVCEYEEVCGESWSEEGGWVVGKDDKECGKV